MADQLRRHDEHTEEFYETMPMAVSPHYVYRDDAIEAPIEVTPNARRTAIITLVLVALVAVAMGLLIVKGLGLIRGDLSSPVTNTNEL